jgi:hypothetical protein
MAPNPPTLKNRFCADELLRPAFGKGGEAMEDVFLSLILKSHTPIKLDVAFDGVD